MMAGRSFFQLANLRSQQASGQDQRQLLRDYSASTRYQRTVSARTTLEAIASFRSNLANLFGKLEVSRRTQAIRKARDLQLIP